MNDDEKEKYLLASRLPSFKHKVEKSLKIISDALKLSNEWAISFSGGKDSTVLADLLYLSGWAGHGIYFWYSQFENPSENDRQVEWANQRYGFSIEKEKCFGSVSAWREVGHFFVMPENQKEKIAARKCSNDFKKISKKFMDSQKLYGIFMGMTKEESRARMISLTMRGPLYETKSRGGLTCCPLANWAGTDIWAYIVSRKLPYLSIYDLPYWSRERIRNELTVLYCPNIILKGELLQYQLAYPDLFNEMEKEFPEVRQYAY